MKKLTFAKYLSIAFLFIAGLNSCKKDELPPDLDPDGLTFQKVIDQSGNFDTPSEFTNIDDTQLFNDMDDTYIYQCTTETYSVNAASGGSTGFPLFDLASDVIYPGSMLQGNSLSSGNPNPIVVERAGGTISTNILDGNLISTFEVDKVSKSSITNAMNNIIASATGTLPSNFSLNIVNIQTREQFALEMDMGINSTFVDLEANLNYTYDINKNSFLVRLNQSYYTMSFDLPTSLDALFAPSVTPQDLLPYVGPSNPATYISSVTYGRVFYMLIESTSSKSEMETEINAAFNQVITSGTAGLNVNALSNLENVSYNVFAYGGDASPTFEAVAQTNVSNLVSMLGQSSTLESGKPLSYVVRSVKDNSTVATQLATTYSATNCDIIGSVGTVPAISHWSGHEAFEDFGGISAITSEGNNTFILYNAQGQYLTSTFQNGVGTITGPSNLSASYPLNGVGAACNINGPTGIHLALFDEAGTTYCLFNKTTNTYSSTYPIQDFYAGYTNVPPPFAVIGLGALAYADKGQWNNRNILFNKAGDSYTWYNYLEPIIGPPVANYDPTFSVLNDWGGGVLNGKIDGVSAATGFALSSSGDHYYILFNNDGDKFVMYGNLNGTGEEAIGPFIL